MPSQATALEDRSAPLSVAELTNELSDYAQAVLDRARQLNIDGVELSLSDSRAVEVSSRCQKLESVEFSGDFSAAIRVVHQKRLASAAISERSLPALLQALENAYEISRFTETDPLYGLPEPSQMCEPDQLDDLQLYYPYDANIAQLEKMVLQCEQAGFDTDTRISNSEGAGITCGQSVSVFANSHGSILSRCESNHHIGLILLATDKDSNESSYYFSRGHRLEDLEDAEAVGQQAAQKAVARLHPRKPKTITCPVIYTAEIAGGFLEHLLSANDGSSIKRGDSFLIGKLDQQVANTLLNMRERPHRPGGIASRHFDAEGVRTQDNSFVESGRLLSHSLDCYHARYLGQQTTANSGGLSNIEVDCSPQSEAELMAAAGSGVLLTDLIGFGVNGATGDYSRGATGFWFDGGEIQYPVNEFTVAGRLQDAYANIQAIANNRWPHHFVNTGSVLVGQMTVGGAD